jgi:molybdenum cofactor cytidylyltransferase
VSPAALILAAGESRRMGSPKALLPYAGASFLDTLIALVAPRCSPVVVVLGAAAGEIRASARRPAVFVVNPEWRRGQTSSMQCGLRAVPPEAAGVLFTLVDHPAVAPATIDALLDRTWDRPSPFVACRPSPNHDGLGDGALLRVPRYRGRRGHPIWFSRELIPEFLALPAGGAARDVVRRHAADTGFLDLDDAGIVADIDDPADYAALLGDAP